MQESFINYMDKTNNSNENQEKPTLRGQTKFVRDRALT